MPNIGHLSGLTSGPTRFSEIVKSNRSILYQRTALFSSVHLLIILTTFHCSRVPFLQLRTILLNAVRKCHLTVFWHSGNLGQKTCSLIRG